jgi:carbonic anhydrase
MRYHYFLAPVVAFVCSGPIVAEGASHHWSYVGDNGPSHWAATCNAGQAQSPIDIKTSKAQRKKLPALKFDYRPGPLMIIDNGHSVQVNIPNGSTMSVGADRFRLVQFHFHKPSEEMIDGRRFDMVVHLVHRDGAGRLAVVAVPLSAGAENPFIATLWRHLPTEKGREVSPAGVMTDPTGLLPANRAYFTYVGSLTTPPCSQGVRWFVMRSPASISAVQISAFGKHYRANARPIQPLNGRQVLASE